MSGCISNNKFKTGFFSYLFCAFLCFLYTVGCLGFGLGINAFSSSVYFETVSRTICDVSIDNGCLYRTDIQQQNQPTIFNSYSYFELLFGHSELINNTISAQAFVTDDSMRYCDVSCDDFIFESIPLIGISDLTKFFGASVIPTSFNFQPGGIRCSVSYRLAQRILGIESDLTDEDLSRLKNMSCSFGNSASSKPLLIYSIIEPRQDNYIFNCLGQDFVIFHDVEYKVLKASFWVYCLPGTYLNSELLTTASKNGLDLGVSLEVNKILSVGEIQDITGLTLDSYNPFSNILNVALICFGFFLAAVSFLIWFVLLKKTKKIIFLSIAFCFIFIFSFYEIYFCCLKNLYLLSALNNYYWLLLLFVTLLSYFLFLVFKSRKNG